MVDSDEQGDKLQCRTVEKFACESESLNCILKWKGDQGGGISVVDGEFAAQQETHLHKRHISTF